MLVASVAVVLLAGAYAWRWRSSGLSAGRLCAFLTGVVSLWAAVASPLAHMDQGHLTAHMLQHLLIMTVAAPLLLLGEPAYVLRSSRASGATWPAPHPALCWFAGTFVVLAWHVPAVFEVGMRWHAFQHATFLFAGLLFWVPVIRPWPTVSRWPRWSIPAYLFLATLPCDALSAFLAFCGRVVYPRYASIEDQARAGALMWFWVTFAYLVPAALVTIQLLSPQRRARPTRSTARSGPSC